MPVYNVLMSCEADIKMRVVAESEQAARERVNGIFEEGGIEYLMESGRSDEEEMDIVEVEEIERTK